MVTAPTTTTTTHAQHCAGPSVPRVLKGTRDKGYHAVRTPNTLKPRPLWKSPRKIHGSFWEGAKEVTGTILSDGTQYPGPL